LNYFKNTCWQRSTRDLNDAKEAELCAIAEDHFKDIKNKSMREVAKAQYVTDALDKNSAIVCDLVLVKEKFGGSKDDLYSRYNDQMNHVVKNVLFFHPGLLQKRIIVFPSNLRNNHWGATFVFNAGDITAAIDDASSGSCRICFFATAVFILVARQGFQTRWESFGSLTLRSVTRRNRMPCKSCQHSKPNEVAQSFWTNFFRGYEGYQKIPCVKGVG